MSFSAEVKDELEKIIPGARHCQMAELLAIVQFGSEILHKDSKYEIVFRAEHEAVSRKYFTLVKKTFMMDEDLGNVLSALKLLDNSGTQSSVLLKHSCCKRAYLRGAFLCIGSMSDPQKSYHLEFVCDDKWYADQLKEMIASFGLEAKIVCRKKYYVVYLKDGESIVDLLNVMGTRICLLQLENLRVEKEIRNSINRKANCEVANITKTVVASSKQIDDILYLQKNYGMNKLPKSLKEMAEVRLEYPDSSLQELGGYLNPRVGKSGVNHRLRKLSEMAERLRCEGGELL